MVCPHIWHLVGIWEWRDADGIVVFIDNSDPYSDEPETILGEAGDDSPQTRISPDEAQGGLEALSAAATTNDRLAYHPPLAVDQHSIQTSEVPLNNGPPGIPPSRARAMPASPPMSVSSNNNTINFLLNPSHPISPPIDPSLHHSRRRESFAATPSSLRSEGVEKPHPEVETEHETAFLLRHYSEAPGLWMDLFDLGTYFASYVPVKALTNPLLKYAACAYAAKQLGRVKGAKAPVGGVCSKQAVMETWPDARNVNWSWYGAKYYEKAIQFLMKELQRDKSPLPNAEPFGPGQTTLSAEEQSPRKRRKSGRLSNGVHSDEVLAATAILSIYEFLDATDPAWNRHLSGVKSLLDLAEVGMMPLEHPSPGDPTFPTPRTSGLSKARKATFWNFARQDYLAACMFGSVVYYGEC